MWVCEGKIDAYAYSFDVKRALELEVRRLQVERELETARRTAAVEVTRFKRVVSAIGTSTLESIARAGPEMQAKMMEGLGLQGFLITDGKSPLNLFDAGNALIGPAK